MASLTQARWLRRALIVLIAIAVVAAAVWWISRPYADRGCADRDRPRQVEATVANTRAGTVEACQRTKLSTIAGGRIEVLAVKEGDKVRKGQLLMRLWNDDQQAEQAFAQAQLETTRRRVAESCTLADLAQREFKRQDQLFQQGFISEGGLDNLRAQADARVAACATARSDVAQAQARINVVGTARQRTVLVAPFDGTVAKIVGEVGEYSTPSPPGVAMPPAIDLIDETCLYVAAPMDEVDAPKIATASRCASRSTRCPASPLPARCGASRPMSPRWRSRRAQSRSRSTSTTPSRRPAAGGLQRRCRGDPRRAPGRAARAQLGAAAGRPGAAAAGRPAGRAAGEDRPCQLGTHRGRAGLAGRRAHRHVARPRRRQGRRDRRRRGRRPSDPMATPSASAGEAQIELQGIERVFHLGDSVVHALAGIDLRIEAGEYIAVMGPSGSGKSTLLNVLGLLDRPDAGHYRLEGRDVTTLSPDEQARVRSHRIGFVFQSFHLVPRLTAAENIALPMVLAGLPARERDQRVRQALDGFGLADRAEHRPDQLSGGQRQRVAIARATIMQPAMLLADEPTGNLDRATGDEVVRLLEQLNAGGVTLLVVTHDRGTRRARAPPPADGRWRHPARHQAPRRYDAHA